MRKRECAPTRTAPFFGALEPRLLMSGNVLIVTNAALSSAFQEVADWYTRKGYAAEVVTTESIYAEYAGRDNQEKIRTAIQDYHTNRGVEYVLLGGDDTVVPDRNTYVRVGGYTESSMPTDLYYSGLEGTWDSDGDSIFGEAGQDTDVDLTYDVILGRYPVRTVEHVETLLSKVIAYETTPAGGDWATSMLATGDKLWNTYAAGTYRGIEFDHTASDAEIKSYYADDLYVAPYWDERQLDVLFDTKTSWDSETAGDYAMSPTNLIETMGSGYQFMHMATHGSYSLWGTESGGYFSSNSVNNLSSPVNASIVSTIACMTGGFDKAEHSLSEAFLRSPDSGTIIYLGSSRYGWGYASTALGPSFRYSYQFYKEFLANGHTLAGEAFAESKQAFQWSSTYDGATRWVQFGLNFQGDPLVQMYRTNPGQLFPTYDYAISEGSQQYVISDLPTGATVVLWQGDDVYETGTTDGNGEYATTIDPVNGLMKLTVIAQDYAVFTDDIVVSMGEGGETPGTDGTANDILYDAAGNLHFAWFDRIEGNLKYAWRDVSTGEWSAPIAVDASSSEVGRYVSMAIDSNGYVGLAYYDAYNANLKYAHYNGSSWDVETVQSSGKTGLYPSLAFDADDTASIAYYKSTGGYLMFATQSGPGWSLTALDGQVDDIGRFPSLAMNPGTGRWSVAYEDTTGGTFKYAEQTGGGGWTVSTFDSATINGGGYISLAFDGSNEACVSYYDAYNADLKFARRSGGNWTAETVASKNSQGLYTSLFFNADGDVQIAYWHKTADNLVLASRSGDGWTFDVLVAGAGREAQIAMRPGFGGTRFTASWYSMYDPRLGFGNVI